MKNYLETFLKLLFFFFGNTSSGNFFWKLEKGLLKGVPGIALTTASTTHRQSNQYDRLDHTMDIIRRLGSVKQQGVPGVGTVSRFVFLCFCFFALFIDLVTDKVQPLSRGRLRLGAPILICRRCSNTWTTTAVDAFPATNF